MIDINIQMVGIFKPIIDKLGSTMLLTNNLCDYTLQRCIPTLQYSFAIINITLVFEFYVHKT